MKSSMGRRIRKGAGIPPQGQHMLAFPPPPPVSEEKPQIYRALAKGQGLSGQPPPSQVAIVNYYGLGA